MSYVKSQPNIIYVSIRSQTPRSPIVSQGKRRSRLSTRKETVDVRESQGKSDPVMFTRTKSCMSPTSVYKTAPLH